MKSKKQKKMRKWYHLKINLKHEIQPDIDVLKE